MGVYDGKRARVTAVSDTSTDFARALKGEEGTVIASSSTQVILKFDDPGVEQVNRLHSGGYIFNLNREVDVL